MLIKASIKGPRLASTTQLIECPYSLVEAENLNQNTFGWKYRLYPVKVATIHNKRS